MTNQLRDLSRELDSDQLRTQAIVSIDATSRMREGREAEFWIDTRKIHCFDPASGDNLTRDAEAGAALTREAAEDRESDLAASSGSGNGQTGLHHTDGRTADSQSSASSEATGSRRL